MIALIQRVQHANVEVEGVSVGAIGPGLLALVAVQPHDTPQSIERMAERLLGYRVFEDEAGKMNLSVQAVQGGVLLVSQFTLAADTDSGMRPSFTGAAKPEQALQGFEALVAAVRCKHPEVATGRFGAHMQISLLNDGPVTFWLET
jgi:D-tyrosyl-tRNA(Tyr) deacylase